MKFEGMVAALQTHGKVALNHLDKNVGVIA